MPDFFRGGTKSANDPARIFLYERLWLHLLISSAWALTTIGASKERAWNLLANVKCARMACVPEPGSRDRVFGGEPERCWIVRS